MKISEVATKVGLPISTLRYYEKMGIITEEYILREENNYRNYVPEIIQYIEVVKNCLAVGFSIQDIKDMIAKHGMSRDEQARIIHHKIAEIEDAQKKMEASKQSLYEILDMNITCEDGFGKT
ncbi:MerR family transcriptional regulator [Paenibacillus sp. FSL K6-1096]|uniref:MerR family transcriptional regulator n=1 Tax=Paenibacillus sp. FSL K6-1096 TaxID=2921460 RepID=UPI0030ED0104